MGKSSVFVFATATRNEPATARLFSILLIWTSVQIFRVLGMSCAVFLWNFFPFGNLSKCFRPDLRLRFEGWPGVFSFHLFRIQVQYLESSNADRRLTAELFLPGRSFFRSAEDLWKAPSPTGVVFTTSTDSYPSYPPPRQPRLDCSMLQPRLPTTADIIATGSLMSGPHVERLLQWLPKLHNTGLLPTPPDSLCTDLGPEFSTLESRSFCGGARIPRDNQSQYVDQGL